MHGWLPDGTPLTPETAKEFVNVVHTESWMAMLASPRLWGALRRIPPKAFLLDLLDSFLEYAKSGRDYGHDQTVRRQPDLPQRNAHVKRLRDLLLVWEPPAVTSEIHEAAFAVIVADQGAPPAEGWDDPNDPSGIPLEASLIWPEGKWDEEAFRAGLMPGPLK